MAAGRMVIAGWMPALDVNGLPIPNAQMYFYENNTTNLATVYADQALTVPLSNPVLANSSGQFPDIWADDVYLFSVTIDAPYGPPGQPFSFNNIGPATSANNTATNKADRDGSNIEVLPFRSSLGYGTAALLNVGTGPAQIPALGEDGKLPSSVLPENGSYQGGWDASTNTPEIVSGTGNNGDFYYVNVAGNTVIDGYPADPLTEEWEIGDQIRFSSVSNTWERIPGTVRGRNLGGWDAFTNTPEIVAGTGIEGDFYTVVVEGTQDLGAGDVDWKFGDQALFTGGAWTFQAVGATPRKASLFAGATDVDTLARFQTAAPRPIDYDAAQFQLPTGSKGALNRLGNWNANTNSPTITSSVGSNGDYRIVTVAGSTNIDGTSSWSVNDIIRFNGTTGKWEKVADQGALVQAMINGTAAGSGKGQLDTGVYYVNRDVTIPPGRTLAGAGQSGAMQDGTAYGERKSTLVFGPAGRLIMCESSSLRDLNIIGFDASTPPTSQANAETRLGYWTGTAVKVFDTSGANPRLFGHDVTVQNVTVIGFDTAFDLNSCSRYQFDNVKIDCHNGVKVLKNYDQSRFNDLHIWAFWTLPYNTTTARQRNGTGIKLGGTGTDNDNDGVIITNLMCHGWVKSVHIVSGSGSNPRNYNVTIINSWLESSLSWADARGDIGIHVEGRAPFLKLVNVHADSQKYGFYLDHTSASGQVQLTNCSSASCTRSPLYLGAGPGIITNFLTGGSAGASEPIIATATTPGFWKISGFLNYMSGGSLFSSGMSVTARRKIKIDALMFHSNNSPTALNETLFRSNVEAHHGGASQTIPASSTTDTVVVFDTKVNDGYVEYNPAAGVFTCIDTGIYEISAGVSLTPASASASQNYILSWVNTTTKARILGRQATTATTPITLSGATQYALNAGDTLQVTIRSTVGGTIAADSAGSWLTVRRV